MEVDHIDAPLLALLGPIGNVFAANQIDDDTDAGFLGGGDGGAGWFHPVRCRRRSSHHPPAVW